MLFSSSEIYLFLFVCCVTCLSVFFCFFFFLYIYILLFFGIVFLLLVHSFSITIISRVMAFVLSISCFGPHILEFTPTRA